MDEQTTCTLQMIPRVGLRSIALLALLIISPIVAQPKGHAISQDNAVPLVWATGVPPLHLPTILVNVGPCATIPGESYGALLLDSPPSDRPAEQHGDLNLALRGYTRFNAYPGLIDIGGGSDPNAPQLPGLFADNRTPGFASAYRVNDWDWRCNCRGAPITNPEVTLISLATIPGETIHLPDAGYEIGSGYKALVLYASHNRITLKYTREDNVIWGYTIHIENVCVEPSLLTLYRSWDQAGRAQLPALRARQALGRARGSGIRVAIRDSGRFMDPRSRKDWWRGR